MSKQTPGPWEVYMGKDSAYWKSGRVVQGIHGRICDMSITSGDGTALANANLIAAAPEMLEACKNALAAYEGDAGMEYETLIEVIAKAEGKQ